MNKPAKIAGTQTVEDALSELDKQRSANMRVWNALAKTDPTQTKTFKRAGGFSGTAVKPMWVIKRLTEQFGACGEGWGIGQPTFQTVEGDNREVLVYCTVTCWHGSPDNVLYGVGGDKVVTHIKANEQYKRPERWENDDEAFKKAFTDAVNNAFKFVGVAADIHMGLFDDSKYVREVAEEFRPKTDETPPAKRVVLAGPYTCKTQLQTAAKEFVRTLESMGDLAEFLAWEATTDFTEFCTQLERDMPDWWQGGPSVPAEFVPLQIRFSQKRRDLEQIDGLKTKESA